MRQYFSEYFRPTEAETKQAWATAVFIFDTNVLLNLYRMSRNTSLAIRAILKKLKGRLFLTHQVGVEFFKHREEVIAEQVNAFERVRQYLKKIPDRFNQEFSRHPCIPIGEISEALRQCVEEQIATVTRSQNENKLNYLRQDDPILAELSELFADCTEGPYTGADDASLNKDVDDRVQNNLPPCFLPLGGKASPSPANNPHRGDGRVWFQIVKHAGTKKKPIIFVTGDVKPNWWRTAKEGNQDRPIGPHFDLIKDVESASQTTFIMYTQEQFLSEAPVYLDVPEQIQAIDEVRQIRENAAMEKGTILYDESDENFLAEASNLEKADLPHGNVSMEKDAGDFDQPKASPLEELNDEENVKSEEGEN